MAGKKPINKIIRWWKSEAWLNQEQESFCQMYISSDKELFGNGVQSYIEVYDPDTSKPNWYKTACARASKLLSSVKVINRINELLEEWWLNDQNVDKQLSFLITQFDDKANKLWAIKEYNKLKARIIEKTPVSLTYDLTGKSMEEIDRIKQDLLK